MVKLLLSEKCFVLVANKSTAFVSKLLTGCRKVFQNEGTEKNYRNYMIAFTITRDSPIDFELRNSLNIA